MKIIYLLLYVQRLGYDNYSCDSKIISYSLIEDFIYIQLSKTPFYFESGGQVADTGVIYNQSFTLKVLDVQKIDGKVCHITELIKGVFNKEHLDVIAEIDIGRRINIMANHTATHLLHKALKELLGPHVLQAGSLVSYDKLRFDFTYTKKLSKDEIEKLEAIINLKIRNKVDFCIKFFF